MMMRERERERERDRETERQRQTETDRDRQRERETYIERGQLDGHTDKERERERKRKREKDGKTETKKGRQKYRETDKKIERDRHTSCKSLHQTKHIGLDLRRQTLLLRIKHDNKESKLTIPETSRSIHRHHDRFGTDQIPWLDRLVPLLPTGWITSLSFVTNNEIKRKLGFRRGIVRAEQMKKIIYLRLVQSCLCPCLDSSTIAETT